MSKPRGFMVYGTDQDTTQSILAFLDTALKTPSGFDAIVACRAVANALVIYLAARQNKMVDEVEREIAEALVAIRIEESEVPKELASGTITKVASGNN